MLKATLQGELLVSEMFVQRGGGRDGKSWERLGEDGQGREAGWNTN